MDRSITRRFPSTGNGEPPPKPKRMPAEPLDQEVDDVPTEQTPRPEK